MPTAGRPPEVRAYLDHASVSPLRPEVAAALVQVLDLPQADPGRAHDEALVIRDLIESARECVATLVRATPRQLIFTSAIAESITTAVHVLGAASEVIGIRNGIGISLESP